MAVALRAALADGVQWLWLLDGSVAPEPDALARLLEALEPLDTPGGPVPPVLLASTVVTAAGRLHPGSVPVPEVARGDLVVAAYDRRLVALRLARRGSLLVHRRAFEDPPTLAAGSPLDDDLAWSARLLRHELGLLVPASRVVRSAGGGPARGPGPGLRLLTGDALAPRERPWFAFRLAEEGAAAVRGRLVRGAGGGPGGARRAGRE